MLNRVKLAYLWDLAMHHNRIFGIRITLGIVLVFVYPMHSMNNDTSSHNLSSLSTEIIGTIVAQIVMDTGTPSIKNDRDIPVIRHYINALSLSNTSIYHKIHSLFATNIYLPILADRFAIPLVDAVCSINNYGSRLWLKQYLNNNGEYTLFKAMQRIFEIAQEVYKESRALNISIEPIPEKPNANYSCRQTRHGIFIQADSTPSMLYTPWGYIIIFGSCRGKKVTFYALCQEFLKRLKTSFCRVIPSLDRASSELYTLKTTQEDGIERPLDLKNLLMTGKDITHENVYKQLCEKDVTAYNGEEILIFSECSSSLYKVHAVDGYQLPDPELLSSQNYRSFNATRYIWHILYAIYREEKNMPKEPFFLQSNINMVKQKQTNRITSIQTLSKECVQILKECVQQSAYSYDFLLLPSMQPHDYKVFLPLPSHNDCSIVENLCDQANQYLNADQKWDIHTERAQYDMHGRPSEYGISMHIQHNYLATRYPLEQLQTLFDTLINDMVTNWRQITLTEHPDISLQGSEEEYYIFTKQKNFTSEAALIYNFCTFADICSENELHCMRSDKSDSKDLYLWIKKKSYTRIVEALNLQIQKK
jgi:hypothetical protein